MTMGEEDLKLNFESLNDVTYINRSFRVADLGSNYQFRYGRSVPLEEIARMKFYAVPGFQIKWYHNDNDKDNGDIIPDPLPLLRDGPTMQFRR